MTLEFLMLTDRKGSNPGGKGRFSLFSRPIEAYLKYCVGNRLNPKSYLDSTHQPVYEALTLALAKRLGLHVPRFWTLENPNRDVSFRYGSGRTDKKIKSNLPYFFVSELVTGLENEDIARQRAALNEEKMYRDMLNITDISGRKQNYVFISEPGHEFLLYIDLGCSFVDAHDGVITQRNIHTKGRELHSKDRRRLIKSLKKYWIETAHQGEMLNLGDLVENFPHVEIPSLNPTRGRSLDTLLSREEVEEIQNLCLVSFNSILRKYKGSGKVFKDKSK